MRYFLLFLSSLFLAFALVQLNDPDPIIWFSTYLVVCILCFLAYRGKYFPGISVILGVILFIWATRLFPPSFSAWWQLEEESQTLKMKMPGIEEARESMGLIISSVVLFFLAYRGRKLKKSA